MSEYHKKEPRMTSMHFYYLSWILSVKVPEITGRHLTQQDYALIGNELKKTNEDFQFTKWLDEYHHNRRRATHLHPIKYNRHAGI